MPADAAEPHHAVVLPDSAKWGPAPPSLPPGAQATVLAGNPGAAAPFILRLKLPSGYTIPPHRHPTAEMVTVISGEVNVGAGEILDRSVGETLPPAGFVNLPAGMAHFAWVNAETILQISAMGPFEVTYVNAADDPRKR
ncbi:MAG: cupin domain-containing protein [Rhodoferax sp.]|nr:cupin domain-containing protein [Rhodoferax sp.]